MDFSSPQQTKSLSFQRCAVYLQEDYIHLSICVEATSKLEIHSQED